MAEPAQIADSEEQTAVKTATSADEEKVDATATVVQVSEKAESRSEKGGEVQSQPEEVAAPTSEGSEKAESRSEKSGEKSEGEQKPAEQPAAAAKPTPLDNIKKLFGFKKPAATATAAPAAGTPAKGGADAAKKDKPLAPQDRKQILEMEKLYNEGLSSIRDIIAPASFEVAYDHINVEGFYAQSYFINAYPRYLETNWLSPVVNFEVTMDISQFIYPIGSAEIMKLLKRKVAQFQASLRMNREKGNVSDPALETALQDAEQLRTELQRGQEKFFQFAMYFTIYADDLKKLEKITKQLESLLGGKLILTKKANLQQEYAFNSTIPICLDELQVNSNMNTSPLSSTFPFISSELTSDDGILYGLNRHNEGLVIFDRFSLENANEVIFAKSGAGKSYAVKLEILRYLMMGVDVIVIDPENEYQALAESVGGSYMMVSLNSDKRINPFDLPKPIDEDNSKPGDLLRSSIIDLTGLLKLMMGELTPAQEGILDKALLDVYATKGITMDTPNPSEFNPPTMEDFHSVLSSMDGAEEMAQRIQKFTSGTYAGIFNKPTNVSLDKGLVVFSIRDLEDQLRPIAMYIILSYIWNKVRSELKKRILTIDEAWSMMQHADSAKFLYGLVKRARKYYLGVSTITQDVEDFMKSEYGKPIITNSSMQLLLKQSPTAMEMLQKVFNLTEGEKYMLLNSGVGQGLFFAGLKHVAVQIIASYTEDKIITTNPEEVLKKRDSGKDFESVGEEQEVSSEEGEAEEIAESKEQGAEEAADSKEQGAADSFDNTDQLLGKLEETKEVAEKEISEGSEGSEKAESRNEKGEGSEKAESRNEKGGENEKSEVRSEKGGDVQSQPEDSEKAEIRNEKNGEVQAQPAEVASPTPDASQQPKPAAEQPKPEPATEPAPKPVSEAPKAEDAAPPAAQPAAEAPAAPPAEKPVEGESEIRNQKSEEVVAAQPAVEETAESKEQGAEVAEQQPAEKPATEQPPQQPPAA